MVLPLSNQVLLFFCLTACKVFLFLSFGGGGEIAFTVLLDTTQK